ncbi:membrane protein [Microbacterium phage Nicole72]|uniref:Membrane protein n=1 Tax=Microbacterium phage Nicole72 TaxID=3062838 RepID=A0ACD4UHT6_9CAUD|nr:membrane protein [Microbacterium phage Nicole72]
MPTPDYVPEAPVRCRRPVALGECDQPYGHDGPHHTEIELPSHINQGLGHVWNDMERRARSYRRWRYWFMLGTFANVILYLIQIIARSASS